MKHTNKKGFTIVELVIVIAVIAILAAVLIPNLSRLVTKADKSAAMQEAKAAMDDDLINAEGDLENMTLYTTGSGSSLKQVYIVATYTKDSTFPANTTIYKAGTVANGVTPMESTETHTDDITYYTVAEYKGTYSSNGYSYSNDKYICTFANGEWTVADKT